MYFLAAEHDSQNFRLVGEQALSDADLRPDGIRLHIQTFGPGTTKVVLTKITIRATTIVDPKKLVAELDAERAKLPQHFFHDFAKDATTEELFHQRLPDPLKPSADGLPIVSPGTDNWASVGLAPQFGISGDFDIEISLGKLKFGQPKKGKNSGFYLQVEFPDQQKTQANMLYIQHPDGRREAYSQNRIIGRDGKSIYRRLQVVAVESIDRLRLTRRGSRVSYLFQRRGSDNYEMLAQTDIGTQPISKTFIRLILHTGGAGAESEAVLKQFSVHAEKIDPIPTDTSR